MKKKALLSTIINTLAALCLSFCLCLTACSTGNGDNGGNNGAVNPDDDKPDIPVVIGTEGLEYKQIDGKNEYECIGIGAATETDIIIASHYNGYLVTSIGRSAFSGSSSFSGSRMRSVTFKNSVSSISNRAIDCDSLTSVTIPDRESISDLHPTNSY